MCQTSGALLKLQNWQSYPKRIRGKLNTCNCNHSATNCLSVVADDGNRRNALFLFRRCTTELNCGVLFSRDKCGKRTFRVKGSAKIFVQCNRVIVCTNGKAYFLSSFALRSMIMSKPDFCFIFPFLPFFET